MHAGATYARASAAGPAGWTLTGGLTGSIEPDARGATFEASGGTVTVDGRVVRWSRPPAPSADAEHGAHAGASGDVTAPMPGKIVSVVVVTGTQVEQRTLLIVLEAMKMEHRIEAPVAGTVREVRVKPGDLVKSGDILVKISAT
ncbi:MAG: Carbamoyl-phosphate synthase chain ATP-binding protein [Candidatus Eremiobacteraeota bacterium]|nr:Carbamoyl-phosphate synthase chain ATP-binding protein [Candidatus Eremiobacteraeota bacterium]